MTIEHSICELVQNSGITKENLRFYISRGNSFALIMLYLGLTTPKCRYWIEDWWDEDGDGEIYFISRYQVLDEGNIFDAEEGEIEEVTKQVKEFIKRDGEKYQKILVEESNDPEILKFYSDKGDEMAKNRYEIIMDSIEE